MDIVIVTDQLEWDMSGNDDDNPTHFKFDAASWGWSRKCEGQSELNVKIGLQPQATPMLVNVGLNERE